MKILVLKINKRGISPLIATVLLVSFVVILSTVILFWGRQFVTELMEKRGEVAVAKLDCTSVEIEIVSASGGTVTIRNTSPVKLSGFVLRFAGGEVFDDFTILEPYEEEDIVLHSEGNVDIIPMLKPEGIGAPLIPCSNKHKLVKIN